MSELILPPSDWKFRLSLSSSELNSQLGDHRLLSIKSFLDGQKRIYSGVSVKNEGLGGSWHGRITPNDLKLSLGEKFRLTALDCFEEKKQTFCAAAWVEISQPITWNWGFDFTAATLNEKLKKEEGKLISLRAYRTTRAGKLNPAAIRYCAIWVADDGIEWDWIPDALADSIEDTMDNRFGRIISIDNLDNTTWLDKAERFCAVWYKNVNGQVWFWNIGLNKAQLPKEPPKFCSWGLDVSYCSKDLFVSLMEQYPKPGDPDLANLMTMSGSGDATLRDDLVQEYQLNLNEQNLTSEPVTLESAFVFNAAEGGWIVGVDNVTNPAGQNMAGLPLSLGALQNVNASPSFFFTNAPKMSIFQIKAVAANGKHQYLLSQAILTQAGFPPPPPLPISWPVFLGIMGPVEIVKLTNGKCWVTVIGQVINGTMKKLDITSVSVKLKDQGNVTLHKAYLTSNLVTDMDVLGKEIVPALNGAVTNSNAPIPRFFDGFEVPRSLKEGTLKVQANVKFKSGELDCYGDTRTLAVKQAPVTIVDRLPHDVPLINGVANSDFRWHWGNGVGSTGFSVHSYPEHRYSYDIVIYDTNNQSFKDSTKMDQNDNYYCWRQPVLAITSGKVLFIQNGFPDNVGNISNPDSGNNVVVIYNDVLDCFHVYAHFQQNSIVVMPGDTVSPGDLLGLVGNSGASSEPHLHLAISRRDANGFLRSLPMTFLKIKNGAGNTVSGVPVNNDFYGQP